jgi:hypothetical protein
MNVSLNLQRLKEELEALLPALNATFDGEDEPFCHSHFDD